MNLTSGCKTATMKFDHGMKQSAYRINSDAYHAVTQPLDSLGLDYPHLVKIDPAQNRSLIGQQAVNLGQPIATTIVYGQQLGGMPLLVDSGATNTNVGQVLG